MVIKRLTNRSSATGKRPDQKTTARLQATVLKVLSQLLPRYSQPAPQQTGTSQNCEKTAICSVYMSRFGRLGILFSTISGMAWIVIDSGYKKAPGLASRGSVSLWKT
jgi:hypothetical protein